MIKESHFEIEVAFLFKDKTIRTTKKPLVKVASES